MRILGWWWEKRKGGWWMGEKDVRVNDGRLGGEGEMTMTE